MQLDIGKMPLKHEAQRHDDTITRQRWRSHSVETMLKTSYISAKEGDTSFRVCTVVMSYTIATLK